MDRISAILKKYISERIPRKVTNIFWQLFNGCEAMFVNIEYRLDIFKRERNILTAQSLSSLRNLAAQNGFEPSLKIPAKGILQLNFSSALFNRVGYPLFLPAYSEFTDKTTNLVYYYDSSKPLKINTNLVYVPVTEGELKTVTENIVEEPDRATEYGDFQTNLDLANNTYIKLKNKIKSIKDDGNIDEAILNLYKDKFILKGRYANSCNTWSGE